MGLLEVLYIKFLFILESSHTDLNPHPTKLLSVHTHTHIHTHTHLLPCGFLQKDSHETTDLQDDISGLEPKNVKSKHLKSTTHSKQSMTTETPRKTAAVKHEVVHSKTKSNVKSVKRNADEPEPQHDFQRPAKVRKGQLDKESKSCNSGIKSVKSQSHSVLKKTSQDQNVMQVSKPLTHSLSDKLHGCL